MTTIDQDRITALEAEVAEIREVAERHGGFVGNDDVMSLKSRLNEVRGQVREILNVIDDIKAKPANPLQALMDLGNNITTTRKIEVAFDEMVAALDANFTSTPSNRTVSYEEMKAKYMTWKALTT